MQRIWPNRFGSDRKAWQELLNLQGLRPESGLEAVYGHYENGTLVATAGRVQNIIKCVAIHPDYQGGALFNELISHILNDLHDLGYEAAYVYTKPSARAAFGYLGFKELADVPGELVFLERAGHGIADFLAELQRRSEAVFGPSPLVDEKDSAAKHANEIEYAPETAALVMNANPLTLGHLNLITEAAQACERVHLFILSEDVSDFPTAVRLELARRACRPFPNVLVHESGPYLISAQTFPSYFLREAGRAAEVQARLDARLFLRQIVPALGITRRYVGEEPFSASTALYNQMLAEEFAAHGARPKLCLCPRYELDGRAISASAVRLALAEGRLQEALRWVPETTAAWLQSPAAEAVLARLRASVRA